jgi:hypothetical protein
MFQSTKAFVAITSSYRAGTSSEAKFALPLLPFEKGIEAS